MTIPTESEQRRTERHDAQRRYDTLLMLVERHNLSEPRTLVPTQLVWECMARGVAVPSHRARQTGRRVHSAILDAMATLTFCPRDDLDYEREAEGG